MIDIRKERAKQRVAELKNQLIILYQNQPRGVYQFLEWQEDIWEINRKIKLIEKTIIKKQ